MRHTAGRSVLSVIACVALAVSAGCGGSAPEAAQGGAVAAQKPAADAAARPKKNACALFDKAKIEAIAKQTVDLMHTIEADDHTVCEVTASGTDTLLVSVTAYWSGGKDLARVNQASMSMARQMLDEDDVDIAELSGSEKVRGLADKAFYSDLMPSWFLKGDVLIEVLSPRFGHDQTKAIFLAVAKEAVTRL